MSRSRRREPILVTGVPRSGTTWLARWLAEGAHMALPGREPMNPRGNSYALGGTLPGWARLTTPTSAQRRRLRLAYRGLNPVVYSRYGHRQAGAALPWRRLVIKDPFAMLSLPMLAEITGTHPLLVYRHPGAVLVSYRRMGWTPDLDELESVVREARSDGLDVRLPPRMAAESPEAMGHFWSTLHQIALGDMERTATTITLVSHAELAASGEPGGRRLANHLGVAWTAGMAAELAREGGGQRSDDPQALHRFDRAPATVAEAWRRQLTKDDVTAIEAVTEETRARLDDLRLPLTH